MGISGSQNGGTVPFKAICSINKSIINGHVPVRYVKLQKDQKGNNPRPGKCTTSLWTFPACINGWLVGGWATPLKNMSSSVGMMTFPIYGKIKAMFQTTNQMTMMLYFHALPTNVTLNPPFCISIVSLWGLFSPLGPQWPQCSTARNVVVSIWRCFLSHGGYPIPSILDWDFMK